MPPKQNDADLKTDIADIKSSLEFICKSVDELKKSNGVNEKIINDILSAMKIKDQRIDDIERRVNDLEQHSRKRNIIVTGLNVHSYAHAATRTRSTRGSTQTDGEDVSESNEMRKHFVKFAKDKLNVSVEEIEITAIHDLPKRKDGTTPVIVQLLSVDKKTDLISLSVVKFNGLLYDSFVLYCSYSFTLFLYHYIIGHVSTIYYHPTI